MFVYKEKFKFFIHFCFSKLLRTKNNIFFRKNDDSFLKTN